jgi:hypothetical protein
MQLSVSASVLAGALLAGAAWGCHRSRESPAPASQAVERDARAVLDRGLADCLPGTLGSYDGQSLQSGDGWVRRQYEHGGVHIDLTLARMPMTAETWAEWKTQSSTYPLAVLPLPPDQAIGFYSCGGLPDGGGGDAACDLHIQLAAGYHVEAMGAGSSTRRDLDDFIAVFSFAGLSPGSAAP